MLVLNWRHVKVSIEHRRTGVLALPVGPRVLVVDVEDADFDAKHKVNIGVFDLLPDSGVGDIHRLLDAEILIEEA